MCKEKVVIFGLFIILTYNIDCNTSNYYVLNIIIRTQQSNLYTQ